MTDKPDDVAARACPANAKPPQLILSLHTALPPDDVKRLSDYIERLAAENAKLKGDAETAQKAMKAAEERYRYVRDSWDGVTADGTRLISYSVGAGIGESFADRFDAAIDAAIGDTP